MLRKMKSTLCNLLFLFVHSILVIPGEARGVTPITIPLTTSYFTHAKNGTLCQKQQKELIAVPLASDRSCNEKKDLCLLSLYSAQPTDSFQYHHVCGNQFFELFKLLHSKDMMLFGSIYNGNTSEPDFTLLEQAALEIGTNNLTYRLVVRLHGGLSQPYFPIVLNNVSHEVKVNLTGDMTEYMIPDNLKYKLRAPPKLALVGEQQKYVNTSYAVFCINTLSPKTQCSIVERGYEIYCYCYPPGHGILMVGLELFIIWIIMLIILGTHLASLSESMNQGPEVQANMILCMPGRSTHDYLAIIRVGPANHAFNYEKSHLDIQLLTTDDEPVGLPIRFACAHLQGHVSFELHMLICRMSPIPEITALRVHHSDPHNLLHLQDITLVNLRQCNVVEKQLVFNWFITGEPTVFRPRYCPSENQLSQLNVSLGVNYKREWIALLYTWCLNAGEKISICIFTVGFVCFAMMAARIYFSFYEFWKEVGKSMSEFAFFMLAVMAITLILIFTFELLYLEYLKKPFLIESYMQLTVDQNLCQYSLIRSIVLFALIMGGLIFSGATIYLSTKLHIIAAFIWSGTAFSTIALTLGAWFLIDDLYFVPWYSALPEQEYLRNPALEKMTSITSQNTPNMQNNPSVVSAFFPLPQSALGLARVPSSTVSNYGPKLVNPKFTQKIHSELYLKYVESRRIKSQKLSKIKSSPKSIRGASPAKTLSEVHGEKGTRKMPSSLSSLNKANLTANHKETPKLRSNLSAGSMLSPQVHKASKSGSGSQRSQLSIQSETKTNGIQESPAKVLKSTPKHIVKTVSPLRLVLKQSPHSVVSPKHIKQ